MTFSNTKKVVFFISFVLLLLLTGIYFQFYTSQSLQINEGHQPNEENTSTNIQKNMGKNNNSTKYTYSDSDVLPDSIEKQIGTNISNPDTDGDGIPDGIEHSNAILPESDPLTKDVFIEVDWVTGSRVGYGYLAEIQTVFENAPITNPSGERGINIHFKYDNNYSVSPSLSTETYYSDVYPTVFEQNGYGYRHMIIIENISLGNDSSIQGIYRKGSDSFVIEKSDRMSITQSTILHELGHSLGLSGTDYSGIDSRNKSMDSYTSVMNYNYNSKYGLIYSSGQPFDDWEHIEKTFTAPNITSIQKERIKKEIIKEAREK